MPNIAITAHCNLHCPYCFAQQMFKEKSNTQNITLEQFDKILEWISPYYEKTHDRLGIIGGEPTLHPQFKEIMEKVSYFCYKYNCPSILFTNGIELTDNLIKQIPDQMRILINYNDPNFLNKEYYNQLQQNLDFLAIIGWISNKVTFGLNLCEEINDYTFFKDIVNQYKCKKIRLAVSYPNSSKNLNTYYLNMKEKFLDIINFGINNQFLKQIDMDCKIPISYFNKNEQKLIFSMIPEKIYTKPCFPVYEIFPDFTMSSCFAHYSVINCKMFDNFLEFKKTL